MRYTARVKDGKAHNLADMCRNVVPTFPLSGRFSVLDPPELRKLMG